MAMIKGYPDGADITIMDAVYTKPKKDDESGKWISSTMDILFRDNITGLKHHQLIKDPKFQFFMANDDVYIEDGVFPKYLPLNQLHPVTCKYSDLKKTIAELTGQEEVYYDNIRNGMSEANDRILLYNRLFRADMNIEDFYRYEFGKRYTNNVEMPLKKSYIDIETDGINMLGDFPKPEDSPINAITLINTSNKQIYTYLLRDPKNPQCAEFEENLKNPEFFKYIKNFIVHHLGGWKKATRLGVYDLENNFFFYDNEIEMIYDVFRMVNILQPDFLLAWNMAFDIPFIIDRIKFLGYDPMQIIAHPDFPDATDLFYRVDEKNINEPAKAGDFARIPAYTIYLDQMKQFASRRRGQHNYKSNKLDDIAEAIAGIHKYDYRDICTNIVDLPRTNYFIFVMYNIIDVIAQVAIENKTLDIDFVFNKCIMMNTRYSKVHKQTIYEYNRAAKSYEINDNVIVGINKNKWNKKPDRKFKGAYVADYRLIDKGLMKTINGYPIPVFENCDDFDYTALYPSTIRENNMAEENQIGKIFIDKPLHDKDNRFGDPRYDRGGAFIEDFQTHLWVEFCERLLHLAGYADLIDDMREYFSTQATISYPMDFRWENGKPLVNPMIPANGLAIGFSKVEGLSKPFIKYKESNFEQIQTHYIEKQLNMPGGVY